jgi:hypothetical protein
LFDDEVDINTNIKWKRDTGCIIFEDVVEEINLTEDDKKIWNQTSSSGIRRVFGEVRR